jgi:hypothetical protein
MLSLRQKVVRRAVLLHLRGLPESEALQQALREHQTSLALLYPPKNASTPSTTASNASNSDSQGPQTNSELLGMPSSSKLTH